MINEEAVAEIISDAEAIKVIIDDDSEELSLKEQHRHKQSTFWPKTSSHVPAKWNRCDSFQV